MDKSVHLLRVHPCLSGARIGIFCNAEYLSYEEFEDTKGVFSIGKSKKDRQRIGQKKKGQKDKQQFTKHYTVN
jgi:hypothetical protein